MGVGGAVRVTKIGYLSAPQFLVKKSRGISQKGQVEKRKTDGGDQLVARERRKSELCVPRWAEGVI